MERHPTWYYLLLSLAFLIVAVSVAVFVAGGDGWRFESSGLQNDRTKERCDLFTDSVQTIRCTNWQTGLRTNIPVHDAR